MVTSKLKAWQVHYTKLGISGRKIDKIILHQGDAISAMNLGKSQTERTDLENRTLQ